MNTINWQKELRTILEKAGEILLFYWGKQLQEITKKNAGFTTEADLKSEEFLIKELGKLFPNADFWAEESGKSGSIKNGYCWVIDPLDGTTNFAHQIPYFCISVALTYKNEPQIAAIYNPLTKHFFFAQKGMGTWLNETRLKVSNPSKFKDAFIAVGIPYKVRERAGIIKLAQEVGFKARAIRHLGAIALDLANVAAGKFDGVFFTSLAWWDVAAGILLIQEAGGYISNFEGKPITPEYRTCIGGGLLVYDILKQIVEEK